MIDKITDEIAEIRENISILPHTKKADKKKYTEYLAKNITDYKEKEEYIKKKERVYGHFWCVADAWRTLSVSVRYGNDGWRSDQSFG